MSKRKPGIYIIDSKAVIPQSMDHFSITEVKTEGDPGVSTWSGFGYGLALYMARYFAADCKGPKTLPIFRNSFGTEWCVENPKTKEPINETI